MMKKLRWAMDGDFWDIDVSTPRSLDGVARPVPGGGVGGVGGSGHFLWPLGLSRGGKLWRAKQMDFMQRFMALPFLPSYAPSGFTLQRAFTFPALFDSWFGAMVGQFDVHKFVSSINNKETSFHQEPCSDSSRRLLRCIGSKLLNKSLYALDFCSELLLTPDDTLLLSLETNATPTSSSRMKAVLHHKFPNHNFMVEAASPGLFLDTLGAYWDVPLSIAIDLASVSSDSGLSYRLCLHQNNGTPQPYQTEHGSARDVPAALQPGLCVKSVFSYKKNLDIWRSTAQKLKMVQPFDILLSTPHISASATVGAAVIASLGHNSVRSEVDQATEIEEFSAQRLKPSFFTDSFASLSFTAQHGNFQRLFSDLTRVYARLDFPSGLKLLSGSSCIAQDIYNSRHPSAEAVSAICPSAFVSLQQQILGPFSFRVDSGMVMNSKNRNWQIQFEEPVFAVEYALHVLGSAKAVAWYSVKHREFMVELRFFEK